MEEKTQDKYQELIGDEPTVLEEKPSLEEKVSVPSEQEDLKMEKKTAEAAEKKPEIIKEKKIEAEPVKEAKLTKEEPKPEIRQPAEEGIEEGIAPTVVPPSAQVQKEVKKLKDLDRQSQVKALCDLAFQKELDFAIEVAKGLDNAYVLDELHDSLVDELYKKLVEQGKLKKL
jgi:hypothetical protein